MMPKFKKITPHIPYILAIFTIILIVSFSFSPMISNRIGNHYEIGNERSIM
jgi:hypothetical protein